MTDHLPFLAFRGWRMVRCGFSLYMWHLWWNTLCARPDGPLKWTYNWTKRRAHFWHKINTREICAWCRGRKWTAEGPGGAPLPCLRCHGTGKEAK